MDKTNKYLLLLIFSGLVFYFPFLGSVHLFDWDEINFAESAREMIVTGNYSRVQINYEPFWEKPPLFFWMQVCSMKLFGVNEFAARFPNALMGLTTLITLFFIGKKQKDERFGFLWALCYLGSFLPHLYFKSGIIDPTFNYFIFLALYFFARSAQEQDNRKHILLSGLFIGLAVLTKGPVSLLLMGLTVVIFWGTSRFKKITNAKNILLFISAAFIVTFLWFGLETVKNGTWFIKAFIDYQFRLFSTPDSGHNQPFYYHFLVVFLGCFPMSVFALLPLVKKIDLQEAYGLDRWMKILFWVVMILFSIVKTKIVHYSSLSYFPLSFLAAQYIYKMYRGRLLLNSAIYYILLFVAVVFSLILCLIPVAAYNKTFLFPYIKDAFAVAGFGLNVYWNGYEFLIGLFYLFCAIYSLVIIKRQPKGKGFFILFYSTAACLFSYTMVVVPKIEAYSQGPAIAMYKALCGKDVYVTTQGFKSYAQYFYFKKPLVQNLNSNNNEWLLKGEIDKPVFFVSKNTGIKFFEAYPEIKKVYSKGGFVLFYRPVPRS
jgi:4-amino-4-deoxy-L-arabinose transferase-like glycosyltransferase